MPATIKVKVIAARDLPVMDRASEMADPFVEIKFGSVVHKTEIYPKSLNPFWNSDWYIFEADDDELQDESLQFRVMDYDTYSANDAIGRVYLDLSSVLWNKAGNSQINGWFPIYDTMRGIRGELNICIKVSAFVDINRYGNVCVGFEMFTSSSVPSGYHLVAINGFVEHMVVSSDPEYQWIDKLRTPRASNEARQALFAKLSGSVARMVNRKVVEMGGNAVVGYSHHFDMESGTGIVVRGLGTAVTLDKLSLPLSRSSPTLYAPSFNKNEMLNNSYFDQDTNRSIADTSTKGFFNNQDLEETPAKPLTTAKPAIFLTNNNYDHNNTILLANFAKSPKSHFSVTECPFLTMRSLPHGVILNIGGLVSAKSVKLLKDIDDQDNEEARQIWWREIRYEMRSNMKALNCNAIVGYDEKCSLYEELYVLCASGTAVLINCPSDAMKNTEDQNTDRSQELDQSSSPKKINKLKCRIDFGSSGDTTMGGGSKSMNCFLCHVPYSESTLPFPIKLNICHCCGQASIPEILLTTMDLPPELILIGSVELIQARVVRTKTASGEESSAKELSCMLPFIEHQLHTELVKRMKVLQKNAIFGLRTTLSVGESHLIVAGTGTAVCLSALVPKSSAQGGSFSGSLAKNNNLPTDRDRLLDLSSVLDSDLKLSKRTRHVSGRLIQMTEADLATSDGTTSPPVETMQFSDDFSVCNTSPIVQHAVSIGDEKNFENDCAKRRTKYRQSHMLMRVARYSVLDISLNAESLAHKINYLLKSTLFKFRRMKPVSLSNVEFNFDLSPYDLQITMTALLRASGPSSVNNFDDSSPPSSASRAARRQQQRPRSGGAAHAQQTSGNATNENNDAAATSLLDSPPSPAALISAYRKRAVSLIDEAANLSKGRTNVFITPLAEAPENFLEKSNRRSTISSQYHQHHRDTSESPGRLSSHCGGGDAGALRYVGRYDFCFIRETHSLREQGGLDRFLHAALADVLSVVQAHVAAFGGHGLLSFQCTNSEVLENSGRNQAQCLLAVAGDIVAIL